MTTVKDIKCQFLFIEKKKLSCKGIYLIYEMVLKLALYNRKGEKDVYESWIFTLSEAFILYIIKFHLLFKQG